MMKTYEEGFRDGQINTIHHRIDKQALRIDSLSKRQRYTERIQWGLIVSAMTLASASSNTITLFKSFVQ